MISYASIRTPRTQDEILAERIQDLQGISPVTQHGGGGQGSGLGTGKVLASGVALSTLNISVLIAVGGEPDDGVAKYQLSTDGGVSFGPAQDVVSTPITVGSCGAVITFQPDAANGVSFVAGESYAFSVAQPTWSSTAWQPFSAPRRLIDLETRDAATLDQALADMAAGGLLMDAAGSWLDLIGSQVYGEARHRAVFTQGYLLLSDVASAGPFAFAAGDLWARDATGQLRFSNVSGGTVPLDGSLLVLFQAESTGSAWNVGNGALSDLATPIPGLAVASGGYIGAISKSRSGAPNLAASGTSLGNYALLVQITTGGGRGAAVFKWSKDNGVNWSSEITVPSGGIYALFGTGITLTFAAGTYAEADQYTFTASTSWITQAGSEIETDENYRTRCQQKWATLAQSDVGPAQQMQSWAQQASAQVTQAVAVEDGIYPGKVDLYLATSEGSAPADVLAAVEAFVAPRLGLCEILSVASATAQTVALAGTVYVRSGTASACQAAALAALSEYIAACPIGGYPLGSGGTGLSREMLIACIAKGSASHPIASCVDITLATPSSDVSMSMPSIPVLTTSGLNWVEVSG